MFIDMPVDDTDDTDDDDDNKPLAELKQLLKASQADSNSRSHSQASPVSHVFGGNHSEDNETTVSNRGVYQCGSEALARIRLAYSSPGG